MTVTANEMRGILKGKCLPGDLRVNEEIPDYLVRKFAMQAARIAEQQAVIDQRNGECDRLINELAALREQEPVGYIDPDSLREYRGVKTGGSWSDKPKFGEYNQSLPIFTQPVPPAPVAVPDKLPKQLEVVGYNDGWNACRAEVLRLNNGSKSDDE